MDDRTFPNTLSDYKGTCLLGDDGKLLESLRKPLQQNINKLLERLYSGLDQEGDENYTVYTGVGGIALLHLHLYEVLGKDRSQLECAIDCLKRPLRHLKGRRISFLCGDAGPLALAAVIHAKLGNAAASSDCIKRLEVLHRQVCEDKSLPDELLYGRVGYIYALLFVKAHLGSEAIDNDILLRVYKTVIDSGVHMSRQQGWKHPLMYAWHEKHYLGAAHGLAGIFYILMQRFEEERYLEAAKRCAEVIWTRGLLKKGYGICHGVAGNGYAHLAMYQLTRDQKYLHRAYKFAEWCFDYGKHGCRRPDAPYSLFEGLAGTIYFLADLLDPDKAKFPAFYLP